MKNKITLIIFLLFCSTASATVYDWVGGASPNPNAWTDKNNWKVPGTLGIGFTTPSAAPSSTDDIQVGVNFTFSSGNAPIITSNTTCASLSIGTLQSSTITVSGSSVTLTVTGAIKQLPSTISISILGSNTVTGTLAGTGNISCASVQAGDLITFLNVLALTTNNVQLVSSVANLTVSGNIGVYSTAYLVLTIPLGYNNAAFYLRGGTATVAGQIATKNVSSGVLAVGSTPSSSTFTIDVPAASTSTPNLKLTNATPLDGTSIAGSIDFYNNGGGSGTCSVEYSGASAQTVYTESSSLLNISPSAYQNIIFSSAGTKNVGSGNLSINGDWSSASGKVDVITNNPSVIFGGGTQSLSESGSDSGNGVVFKNVFFQGTNTKTMSGAGKFAVSSLGILTMGGSATLVSGGILTLKSDASGSATVASVPSGTAITGNVNVQRYVNGGAWYYRGYRLLTSPVNNGSGNFRLEYLKLSAFVTGTTQATGGFDTSPNANNPSIYFFRENTAYTNNSFTTGNFRGVNSLGSTPYSFDNEGSTYSLPSGNGFLFFFRGDRSSGISSATVISHVPENTTFTATGTLNQGNITVKQWYTGGALIYTTTTGSRVQGYNLVGNPYASTINFEKFNRKGTAGAVADASSSIYISGQQAQVYTTNSTLTPPSVFIWVFNPTTKQYETYQQNANQITSVADTTTTVNPGLQSVTGGVASNMIASGQGFFIRATASGQTMTFRESAKTSTQPNSASLTGVFSIPKDKTPIAMAFSSSSKLAATEASTNVPKPYAWPMPLIRLRLIKDSINFDGVVIVLVKGVSSAYNADKDAEDLGGNGAPESLSVLSSDSVKITIHRRPFPGKQQQTIPLFVDATASGDYKLRLTDLKDLPDLYEVWIKDNLTKDSVLAKVNSDYNFSIDKTNPASFGMNRFQLIVRQSIAHLAKLLNFTAQKINDCSKLSWIAQNEANYTTYIAQRSTDDGKTFITLDTVYSSNAKNYAVMDAKPANGLNQYRLTQIDLNGDTTLSKIVPLMYADTKNTISEVMSIYPNPATDVVYAQMRLKTNGPINYRINITNMEGKVVATANASQASWQNNVDAFIPGTYIMQVVDVKDNTLLGVKKFIKK
ncbi:T9SS type A sorting domain-containing protein [Mucilaginibacter celer]|uniref:T9SS C-terminal target domain-containing protein n=1 Tax=Mucilaginibacter celer TaxID=2305508 RepID=A0A494VQP7_9SPHI|nr:T9SS type A sorting domain-containing protein [Mucilaginibacter celer]AYL96301.1 T9SS C-terminal target domain-containing protein [Mucilaginibacter celer]